MPLVNSPRLLRGLWWVLVTIAATVFVSGLARGRWLTVALAGLVIAELVREARVRRRPRRPEEDPA